MKLSTYTDYTLRVLLYLALRHDDSVTIDEIAEAYGISRNHLGKIVHRLGQQGHVETVRGRGGGVRLAVDPGAISIGAVARVCERDSALVECFSADNNCCIASACVLRTAFAEAEEAFFLTLDGYSLADLVRPRRALAQLLAASV